MYKPIELSINSCEQKQAVSGLFPTLAARNGDCFSAAELPHNDTRAHIVIARSEATKQSVSFHSIAKM